jgi:hypothetical protein
MLLQTEPHPLFPRLICSVFFPTQHRTTATAPRCNSPSPHHPVPIPFTGSLPTLSSCSSARAGSTPTAPLPESRSPRAAARQSRPSSVLSSTAPSTWSPAPPGRQTAPRWSTDAHAPLLGPCSPSLHRERRCAATAAAPVRRPLCSPATSLVLPCPMPFRGPVDGVRPPPLAGVLAAGGNTVVPDVPAVAGSGKALFAISSVVPRVPVQNYRDPP